MAPLPYVFDPMKFEPWRPLRCLPYALQPLVDQKRWCGWRWEEQSGKRTKVPYDAVRLSRASSADPNTWCSHSEACDAVDAGRLDGIGYMLKDADIGAFDLDDCRDPETGRISDWAQELINEAHSYKEITVSGRGLRIIGLARGPHIHRKFPMQDSGSLELYRKATRFIVVTGNECHRDLELELEDIDALFDKTLARFTPTPAPLPTSPVRVAVPWTRPQNTRRDLPAELERLIQQGAEKGRRSDEFMHVVGWLKQLGRDPGEIESLLAAHPHGIAEKYIKRLRPEIDRCYAKASADSRPREYEPPDPITAMSARFLHAKAWGIPVDDQGYPLSANAETATSDETADDADGMVDADERNASLLERMNTERIAAYRFDGEARTPEALGGTLQWIAQDILAQSRKRVPAYAMMSAIMFGSVVWGRTFRNCTNGGLNLYSIIVGGSGQGKSLPVNLLYNLLVKVSLNRRLGGRQPSSDSAIEKRLMRDPCLLYCLDEIGKMFESIGSPKAGNHEKRILSFLMEVWSKSTDVMGGKESATNELNRGDDIVYCPTLSLIGSTTPEPFFSAMTDVNVRDGSFARLLLINVNDKPKKQPTQRGFSEDVITMVNDMLQGVTDKLAMCGPQGVMIDAGREPITFEVGATDEAHGAICAIEDWAENASDDDPEVYGVVNRAPEHVVRLASIRALSRNQHDPVVGIDDVKWGWSIVEHSLLFVAKGVDMHMHASSFEAIKKAMLRALERAGEDGLPRWRLMHATGVRQAEKRHQDGALDSLIETRQVESHHVNRHGKGKSGLWFRLARAKAAAKPTQH